MTNYVKISSIITGMLVKCPNEKDMDFICEQFWLGGVVDAPYRFAWTLNGVCGGRVSEGLYLFKTSLFPIYTDGQGWNSIDLLNGYCCGRVREGYIYKGCVCFPVYIK